MICPLCHKILYELKNTYSISSPQKTKIIGYDCETKIRGRFDVYYHHYIIRGDTKIIRVLNYSIFILNGNMNIYINDDKITSFPLFEITSEQQLISKLKTILVFI